MSVLIGKYYAGTGTEVPQALATAMAALPSSANNGKLRGRHRLFTGAIPGNHSQSPSTTSTHRPGGRKAPNQLVPIYGAKAARITLPAPLPILPRGSE